MIIDKKLYKLLHVLPLSIVLGVDSDFSRYKYLFRLTNELKHRDSFVNTYLKDKINILVYPMKYGHDVYIKFNDNYFEKISKIGDIVVKNKESIKAIILPGQCLGEDFLFEIPGKWDMDYEFTFGNTLFQMIFIESFPYGKENFMKLISEAIQQYSYNVSKKVIFYKGIKIGDTDTASLDAAIEKVTLNLKKYVQDLQVFGEVDGDEKLKSLNYNLSAQFRWKKLKEIEAVKRVFESYFEYDYSTEALELLNVGYNGNIGILAEQSFQNAADFNRVKNTNNVGKAIMNNYLSILNSSRDSIIILARRLYEFYLDGFLNVELLNFDEIINQIRLSLKKSYKYKRKEVCPDTSIEYRILCNREGYIVRLKECMNEIVEKNIHLKIKKDIEQKIKECEEKYL